MYVGHAQTCVVEHGSFESGDKIVLADFGLARLLPNHDDTINDFAGTPVRRRNSNSITVEFARVGSLVSINELSTSR